MSDAHTLSSFNSSPVQTESKEEKAVLRAQDKPEGKMDAIVRRMKDKGITLGSKAAWYKLGEKKRRGKPNMKFSIGLGKPNNQTAGAVFKIDF
jgi:hypothetical protein